jgi:hypothetical protein
VAFDDDKMGRRALVSRGILREQLDQSRSDVFSTEGIQHERKRAMGVKHECQKLPAAASIGRYRWAVLSSDIDVVEGGELWAVRRRRAYPGGSTE